MRSSDNEVRVLDVNMLNYSIWMFASVHFVLNCDAKIVAQKPVSDCSAIKYVFMETINMLTKTEIGSDFVFLTNKQSRGFEDIIKDLPTTPIKIMSSETRFTINSVKNSIIFIWVEDGKSLTRILNSRSATSLYSARMILVFLNKDEADLLKIFKQFLSLIVYNVNILKSKGEDFEMISMQPFEDNNCGNSNPIVTNIFNKTSHKWDSKEIFPNKFKNFHKCPLKVSTLEYPPAVMKKYEDGIPQFYGSDIEVMNGLSSAMNFTVELKYIADPYNFGEIFENGSSTGAISHAFNGDADIAMGFYFLNNEKLDVLSNSNP